MKECCMTNKYKYHHLTLEDRTLIQTQLQLGFNPAAIAAALNRPRSCVSRELARNGWTRPTAIRSVGRPPVAGGYCSLRANQRAVKLAAKPRVLRKLVYGNALWSRVTDGLQRGLSPEQIAGTMARMSEPVRQSPRNYLSSDLRHAAWHFAYRNDQLFAFRSR